MVKAYVSPPPRPSLPLPEVLMESGIQATCAAERPSYVRWVVAVTIELAERFLPADDKDDCRAVQPDATPTSESLQAAVRDVVRAWLARTGGGLPANGDAATRVGSRPRCPTSFVVKIVLDVSEGETAAITAHRAAVSPGPARRERRGASVGDTPFAAHRGTTASPDELRMDRAAAGTDSASRVARVRTRPGATRRTPRRYEVRASGEHLPFESAHPPRRKNMGAPLRIELLGGCLVHLPTGVWRPGRQTAALIAALALTPAGLTTGQLLLSLYGERGKLGSLKALVSRSRRFLPISSSPYRLGMPVRSDVDEVRSMLALGDVGAAVATYRDRLLPGSDAPAVREARDVLEEEVRAAVLVRHDVVAAVDLSDRLPEDLEVAEHALVLSSRDEASYPRISTRVRRLERLYGLTPI